MSQLAFDQRTAERLEAAYGTPDILRRRKLVYAALQPSSGERILDVGCGPGFYVGDLLERVGRTGSVTGIDRSPAMLALAAARCAAHTNVDFREADATALPVDSGQFDAAISVQALEYIPAVDTALGELHRVLRPGGRLVIWDVDWTTLSWHSAQRERMERVLRVWDGHVAHPALPRTLSAQLERTGFAEIELEGHAFVTRELSSEAYIGAIFSLLESYVAATGQLPADELAAWAAEQRKLSERGEFFFAAIQFCFTATRP